MSFFQTEKIRSNSRPSVRNISSYTYIHRIYICVEYIMKKHVYRKIFLESSHLDTIIDRGPVFSTTQSIRYQPQL